MATDAEVFPQVWKLSSQHFYFILFIFWGGFGDLTKLVELIIKKTLGYSWEKIMFML